MNINIFIDNFIPEKKKKWWRDTEARGGRKWAHVTSTQKHQDLGISGGYMLVTVVLALSHKIPSQEHAVEGLAQSHSEVWDQGAVALVALHRSVRAATCTAGSAASDNDTAAMNSAPTSSRGLR